MITEKKLRSFYPELQTLFDKKRRLYLSYRKAVEVHEKLPGTSQTKANREVLKKAMDESVSVFTKAYHRYTARYIELAKIHESANSSST